MAYRGVLDGVRVVKHPQCPSEGAGGCWWPVLGMELWQVQEWLGFLDGSETKQFLKGRAAVLVQEAGKEVLDCKACCQNSI